MHFYAGRTQVVVGFLRAEAAGQRRARVRRQRQTGQMQLPGGDQGSHAAVHIVGDPRQGILRRRVLAYGWMRMRIDQTGNRRDPVRINGLIRRFAQAVADRFNDTVFNKNGIRFSERILQLSGDQSTDIFDQHRRHARTIPKVLQTAKGSIPTERVLREPYLGAGPNTTCARSSTLTHFANAAWTSPAVKFNRRFAAWIGSSNGRSRSERSSRPPAIP